MVVSSPLGAKANATPRACWAFQVRGRAGPNRDQSRIIGVPRLPGAVCVPR